MHFIFLCQEGLGFELDEIKDQENVSALQYSEIQEQLNTTHHNLKSVLESNQHLLEKNEELTKKVASKKTDISKLEETVRKSNTKYEDVNKSLKLLTSASDKQKQEISDLKESRETSENINKELVNSCEQANKKVSKLQYELSEKEKRIKQLLEGSENLALKIKEQEKTISHLNEAADKKKVCIWYKSEVKFYFRIKKIFHSPNTKMW